MPNARSLREIVVTLRSLLARPQDEGVRAAETPSPLAVEGRATRPEQVTRRLGERG